MLALAFLLVIATASQLEAVKIKCEGIYRCSRLEKCCYLDRWAAIDELNVTIADVKNSDVQAIVFEHNYKIKFLPVNIYKNFPNLDVYFAKGAAVKEISALNFARLSNLKSLELSRNRIGFIPDDCFQGLSKLNQIDLSSNHISTVNGAAFANLPQLVVVNLESNVCINKLFDSGRCLSNFRLKISRNCASANAAKNQLTCITSTSCEHLVDLHRIANCCELEYEFIIDAPDYTFVDDRNYSTTLTLMIKHQQNVKFLPVSLHESFPSLEEYSVENTPIQKISRKHFEKLSKLEWLALIHNQIEVIRSDTFEDLVNLRSLTIGNNRLTAVNGQAFVKLHKLKAIYLSNSYCVNEIFFDADIRNKADKAISEKCGFDDFEVIEIACEKFVFRPDIEWCIIEEKTAINATNFVIAELRDEEVDGISFKGNKRIEYLPYKIHIQFPNLFKYQASNCVIKKITKENFEKLNRLENIDLSHNQIQKISGNTFQGLEKILEVLLSGNQIKSINGRTFDQLPLLTSVDLSLNKCTDDKLEDGQLIKNFTSKIIQQCAFTETGEQEFEKVFDIECGLGLGGSGFIVGGNKTKRGQWPFMAALIFEPLNQFFCGGSVITAAHVLTAAHCIQHKYKEKPFEASQIVILLGRYDISLRAEVGSEIRGVKEITVHPHWDPRDLKFGGDIAVLRMDRAVQFSEFIQPVCLTVEPEISEREGGYVVGWGNSGSEAKHENVPRQVLISSVTGDVCFARDFRLGSMFAERMFCAGGDGAGPCSGDSGGGFFVNYHGLWTLRGIVSSGKQRDQGGCDVDRYTLFTSALDYTSWIDEVAKKNATLSFLSSERNSVPESNAITTENQDGALNEKIPYKAVYLRRDQF